MADLLVSSAPAEPVRICPACGDVLVSGVCAACAPPPARAYHERAALPVVSKGLVDSRRANAEWSVSPEDLDPHTRKAHPGQLRAAPRDYDLPEPTVRGKRQTQVYKKGGGAPLAAPRPAPAPARAWTLPEPRPEPSADSAQASSTARHARPISPLRPGSGPVSMPTPPAQPEPAPPVAAPSHSLRSEPEPPELAVAEETLGTDLHVEADEADEVRVAHAAHAGHLADRSDPDFDLDPGFTPRRQPVAPVAWLVLAAGALIGVVAALI